MADLTDQLAQVPIFKSLNKKSVERLAKIARARSYKAGDDIVKEGEEGVGFFLISSGKVDILSGDVKVNTLGANDFFGEMALLDNYRRSATVRAVEDTECLALSRWDFLAEVRSNPDIAIELLGFMSHRLREVDSKLQEITKLVSASN